MATNGRGEEALKIAHEKEGMLLASYNLAAIDAQLGQRDKALSLRKRLFFQYERSESVRAKEMMDARVDAVFATLMRDPEFLELTKGADGRLPIPQPKTMNRSDGGM
jgi:hypothetical protein